MKEKLIDIVRALDIHAKERVNTRVEPVMRVHCWFHDHPETFWFTNGTVSMYGLNHLFKYGRIVPKNSEFAIKVQTAEMGSSFNYAHTQYKRKVVSKVSLENRTDFQNQTIVIAGDTTKYQFRDIKEFLNTLQQNQEDIKDIESKIEELRREYEELAGSKETATQRAQITKTIKEYQREYRILTNQQEDLKNITIYIRKQGEMRYSLIVDTIQTRIKTQNIFDGKTVIINGGPGTGKSTTMIHRLSYLTDIYAIKEDEEKEIFHFKLNSVQRKQLREAISNHKDWVFFSPSQLLKEYLADAMRKENLTNTYQKVWNWKDFCKIVLQENYRLLGGADSNAPFKNCLLTDTLFYQGSKIIEEFENFYLNELKTIKSTLPNLDSVSINYEWVTIAKSIQKRFEESEIYDISRFISLFNSLESVYGSDCRNLLKQKNEIVTELADEICELIDKEKEAKAELIDILEITSEESDEVQEDAEETELAQEKANGIQRLLSPLGKLPLINKLIKQGGDNNSEDNSKLRSKVEGWLKSYCYYKLNNDFDLSDEHELICELLLPLLGEKYNAKIQKIGELRIFEQFAQYTKGVKALMLNGMPVRYKRFRTHLIRSQFEGCNLKLLKDIIQRKNGKELHFQEQSLLLGFINNLVKLIMSSSNVKIKHAFIDAYDELSRPIIGVDEATDFSACEIYAMQSFLTRGFNSMTLCGDMMQRMTSHGIKSWDELNGIVQNPLVVEMKTSYRQSKRVLEVAKMLYKDTIGETPSYKAFMKSAKVPAPLAFISENEFEKIEWISKRISEVYRAYGEQLPSIAIFVNDKGYIPRFIENLQETDFFKENDVKIADGSKPINTSLANYICVYPIDVVKGMEFDVVFFHNIDNSSEDLEITKRLIYVGVSRAAFFLGITMSEDNKEISKYFLKNKDWFKI